MVENALTLKEKIDNLKQNGIEVLENHSIEEMTVEVLEKHAKYLERNCAKAQELPGIEHEMVAHVEKSIFHKELECSFLTSVNKDYKRKLKRGKERKRFRRISF